MFSLEMAGHRPAESESYYSLAVRDPYTVGRLDTSDVYLNSADVSRQHATLALTLNPNAPEENKELFDYQRSPERRQMFSGSPDGSPDPPLGATAGGSTTAHADHHHADGRVFPPVMLSVTNFSKFGTTVNGHSITGCVAVESGDIIGIGSGIQLRATYRPVVVTLSHATYSPEYILELSSMLAQLGATVLESPQVLIQEGIEKKLGSHVAPIAMFHLAEEIDSGTDCLAALTLGFSIVAPAYVFEFFASLAENPRRPVHQLPAPVTHAVPVNRNHFPKHSYLRPESDNCPFSLFPRPIKGAGMQRSRAGLFNNRTFYVVDGDTRSRLGMFIAMSGGKVRPMLEDPMDATGMNTTLAPLHYLVLPSDEYVECMDLTAGTEDGGGGGGGKVHQLSQDVLFAIQHSIRVIPEHALHLCLLSNKAVFDHLELSEEEKQVIVIRMLGDRPGGMEGLAGSFAFSGSMLGSGSFHSQSVLGKLGSLDGGGRGRRASTGVTMPSVFMSKEERAKAVHAKVLAGVPASQFGSLLGSPLGSEGGVGPSDTGFDGEEKDSDATPSDIDDEDYQHAAHLEAALEDLEFGDDGEPVASAADMLDFRGGGRDPPLLTGGERGGNQAFGREYARLKGMMAKNILPGLVRVDDIHTAAKKHRYVAPTSIAFLEDTHTQCEQHIAALEALSTTSEGNHQSQVLQVQWDKCAHLQDRIVDTLRVAAALGERQAKRSRLLRSQPDPHRLPAHRPSTSQDRHSGEDSMERPYHVSPEEIATAGGLSPLRDRPAVGKSASPHHGSVREGTRVARYHPPPPVKARIHSRPPARPTGTTGDLGNVKLFMSIMPTQLEEIATHRKVFQRRYGGQEGEVRFGMWLNSQTTQWTSTFYRTLEENDQTMGQLFS